MKESYSSKNIKSGKSIAQIPEDLQGIGLDTYLEEINGYVYAYIQVIPKNINSSIKFQENGENLYSTICLAMGDVFAWSKP